MQEVYLPLVCCFDLVPLREALGLGDVDVRPPPVATAAAPIAAAAALPVPVLAGRRLVLTGGPVGFLPLCSLGAVVDVVGPSRRRPPLLPALGQHVGGGRDAQVAQRVDHGIHVAWKEKTMT